jgi:hypothetical protein
MAQTASFVRLDHGGFPQGTSQTTSVNTSGWLLAKVTLPATSVSDGMTCDVSTYLQTHCYGVHMLGRTVGKEVDYDIEALPSATYTSSQVKFRVRRCSTGALLTAATDLSGESFIAMFIGY